MTRLTENQNNFTINNKHPFKREYVFSQKVIQLAFDFAYSMTFGEDGEHRDHRTGGKYRRNRGEVFINTFQGKLSELAIYNSFSNYNHIAYEKLSKPDFDIYGLGEWDDTDISLGNIKFSIKSTSYKGNLLLLETKDWNNKGEYIPNLNSNKNSIYDYFIFVRIEPDGKKVMRDNRLLYSNEIAKNTLWNIINSEQWSYDIPGYITHLDLVYIIQNNYIIPQGSMLNGWTKMDAENYYIQSGDMRDFKELITKF